MENRPISITTGNSTATFVYDGDGNRALKTENGQTVLYINKYLERNLTTSENTAHYYLGSRQIAIRNGATLSYLHQDMLGGTSVVSDGSGTSMGTTAYLPFGGLRLSSGTIPTDKKFTGQRLDGTGLYYYNARYYDPQIGRFISADSIVPDFSNPQSLNRYSYVLNNPLKYTDPSGHWGILAIAAGAIFWAAANPAAALAITATAGIILYNLSNALANSGLSTAINYGIAIVPRVVSSIAETLKGAFFSETEESGQDAEVDLPIDINFDDKIRGQMGERGWDEDSIKDTVNEPHTTRDATAKKTGEPATAYYNEDGSYVSVNDVTGAVIQISDRNDPDWVPDNSIIDPYFPYDWYNLPW